ncbi:MAG: putative biosynthesis related glycosyltransferase [Mucilaginibacter sp.]|nr:putative biosynthesis related glycosyltransferase [Mucilaginibacter sp.]
MKFANNNNLITVVTVVFNFKDEIENTILSIINQSYSNIEYIIIDGGSVDGTLNIINKYKDGIKICVSEPDKGIFDAMNKSLKLATGDFIIFMNAGDTFCSANTIANIVEMMHEPNSVYYGNAVFVNKENSSQKHRGGYFSKYRLSKVNMCHQTIFYPKSAYKNNNFDMDYKLYADWPYNIKLFSQSKFNYINQDIAFFDVTGVSALNEDPVFKKKRLSLVYEFLGVDAILYLAYNKSKKVLLNLLNIKKTIQE